MIPDNGSARIGRRRFASLTKIRMGDFGVVVANDKVIPVIVADIGPTNKIGEGSAALLSRLAKEGQAHTLAEGVRYIVFPGTSLTREVNADKLALEIGKKIELYERLLLP